jgi:hypothetical protein
VYFIYIQTSSDIVSEREDKYVTAYFY